MTYNIMPLNYFINGLYQDYLNINANTIQIKNIPVALQTDISNLQTQIQVHNLAPNVTLWHDSSIVQSGNLVVAQLDSNQLYFTRVAQLPSSSTDSFYQQFSYPASSNANLSVIGCLLNTGGIFNVLIDGKNVGSWNGYAETTQNNDLQNFGNLQISAGVHTLQFTINCSGVGGGYDASITKFIIQG